MAGYPGGKGGGSGRAQARARAGQVARDPPKHTARGPEGYPFKKASDAQEEGGGLGYFLYAQCGKK